MGPSILDSDLGQDTVGYLLSPVVVGWLDGWMVSSDNNVYYSFWESGRVCAVSSQPATLPHYHTLILATNPLISDTIIKSEGFYRIYTRITAGTGDGN